MVLFDTFGIDAWVIENSLQYVDCILRQLKAFKKANQIDDSYDFCKSV